ncbi:hypothetical protein [Janthinobacterium sp.]|uniref:hypothetical protein n=1 Tax=Janthinobacterium sp. TaxID=1871054 RepID=UPI0025C08254|nr:hypothetical protein [Janthinobacterium sp.]NBV19953.1 hypothetical protein [Janthinobacterium sp.]
MAVPTTSEIRSTLVERMRQSGFDKKSAEQHAEQSVRRVHEQGERTGQAGSNARRDCDTEKR